MQVKKHPNKNLNRNRIIYFQIGLGIVLLLLLISVEWKSYTKPFDNDQVDYKEITFEEMPVVKLPEDQPKPKTKLQKPTDEFKKVDDNTDTSREAPIFKDPKTEFDPDKVLIDLEPVDKEPPAQVPYELVQDVPIFPGCEIYQNNAERKACMSRKLSEFIGKHFDTQLASDLGLEGQNVIYTQFKVSHTGEVIFLDGRASHPKLKAEAQRVIELLPKMTPGKQRLKPVDVIFGLPINFRVND
ncbi:hypothetical protein [Flavobacteriaceae bacterium 14752]|uniref:hypothetical protein n=1 Tax=Mesohalobacter salilacus TaxID=2491711 RepID=UPI000F62E882|nr:hypothetical protein EIG84_07970 [Flavobacteriaceae bacterium 14752]